MEMTSKPDSADHARSATQRRADGDSLTATIQELIDLLVQDGLTVEDVAAVVGPVVVDPGAPLPIDLRPVLAGVRAAEVARYPDTEQPYTLIIKIDPDAHVSAAALQAALGDYRQVRTHRGMPAELMFFPPGRGELWQVVVIAQLEPGVKDLNGGPIVRIAFRRDATSD
jgi:hypothetical protein